MIVDGQRSVTFWCIAIATSSARTLSLPAVRMARLTSRRFLADS